MLKSWLLPLVFISIVLTLMVSCSDSNPDAPLDQNAHPANWANPAATDNHGVTANVNGSEGCTSCHGSDLAGTANVPGCYTCHFDVNGSRVPQGSGWVHGSSPHSQFSVLNETCTNCHNTRRRFDLPPGSCHDCHPGANHPLGEPWLDKKLSTFHGLVASQDVSQCTACHGADFQGGEIGVSCYQCHFGPTGSKVPAGENWTHGTTPHSSLTLYSAVCNQCHNVNRTYGNAPTSCHDCHGSAASHPTGQTWLDKNSPTFHGSVAKNDLASCAQCHGDDYAGGLSGVSCSQCHFGPAGSKVPEGETWIHGTTPHSSLALYSAVCNQCHELNRSYGNEPSTCHDCHGSGVAHPTGQSWLDKNSSTFHGAEANSDLTQCAACHGADYLGGTSGVSCSQCHFGPAGSKVPDGESWSHGTIPHSSLSIYSAVCNQCHNLNRSYGNDPTACHDCHGSGASHPTGQTWLDKKSASFHGIAATNDLTQCAQCHGSDYLGGVVGVTCSQCHFGPAGSRVPPGVSWIHGRSSHDNQEAFVNVCNQCHTVNRTYGNAPASCHNCH